jgi:hypothetical protein
MLKIYAKMESDAKKMIYYTAADGAESSNSDDEKFWTDSMKVLVYSKPSNTSTSITSFEGSQASSTSAAHKISSKMNVNMGYWRHHAGRGTSESRRGTKSSDPWSATDLTRTVPGSTRFSSMRGRRLTV